MGSTTTYSEKCSGITYTVLEELVDSAAAEVNACKDVALRQILHENQVRRPFRRLKGLKSEIQSGALAKVKIPRHEWYFHPPSDTLNHYVRVAFYAHSRVETLDGDHAPFRIERTRRPLSSSGVEVATVRRDGSVLEITATSRETTVWREVTDSEEVENLLLERNAEHLRQCTIDGTPFARSPLNSTFGLYGTSPNADALLEGNLDDESLPLTDEAKTWLHELKCDNGIEEIDLNISVDQFRLITRKCNPRTAASPSGFGYVIWKANGRSDLGSLIFSKMMSIPFQKGFAPSRWKRCTEIMLEKDPGNPMIHRLRIIVLLEADFNLALRTIWMRRLFTQAEKANFVNEQWGNRKNKNALDCLTMKLLTCESARIMKSNMALMAMDAAACYDRILTYLSSMSEQRYRLPVSACRTKGAAIFEMQRHVRTAYGESSNSYTSTTNDLMHGECQGKTSSPPSWAIYTIALLKALR